MSEHEVRFEDELRQIIETNPDEFSELVSLCDELLDLSAYVPSNEKVMLAEFVFAVVTVLFFAAHFGSFLKLSEIDPTLREYFQALSSMVGGLASTSLIVSLAEEWWFKRRLPQKEVAVNIKLYELSQKLFISTPLVSRTYLQMAEYISQYADALGEESEINED